MLALAFALAGIAAAADPVVVVDGEPPADRAANSPADATAGAALPVAEQPAAAAPARLLRIAVYDLEESGLEPHVAPLVTQALLLELRKLDGVSVVGLDEIRAMLDIEANKQLAGCASGTSCLSDVADALGADIVVVGTVARIGDETLLGLRRLDPKSSEVASQVELRLVPAGGEELLAAVGPAVEKLFPDLRLSAGAARGASPELALRLNPPPLPPQTLLATGGVAATAAVVAGVAGVINLVALSTHAQASTPRNGVVDGAAVVAADRTLRASGSTFWIAAGTSAAALLATAAALPFVDWRSDAERGAADAAAD